MRTIRESWRHALGLRTSMCLVMTALWLGGCDRITSADPDAGAVPVGDDGKTIAATQEGITAYIMSGDYLAWGKQPTILDSVRAHGGRARTYFNSKYLQARRSETYPMALGATAIKELYNGTTVYGYSVAIKTRAGIGADTWTWYETTGLPNVQYFGVANPVCDGCHSDDDGRDRSRATMIP